MSGARALASAKRRRAESQNVVTPVSTSSNSLSNIQEEKEQIQKKSKMSPAMMLLAHNKVIENLQEVVQNLNSKIEGQEKNIEKLVEEKMNTTKADDASIEYYKNKLIAVENSLEEIKKHTLKVQTFSMESNLQVVELKKRLSKYEKKEQDNQDKQREQIIENINKACSILTKVNYEIEQTKEAQNIHNNTLSDILHGINNKITCDNVIQLPVEGEEEDAEDEEDTENNDEDGDIVNNEDGEENTENNDEDGDIVNNEDGEEDDSQLLEIHDDGEESTTLKF